MNVGEKLPVSTRIMTRERMRWYCDALDTALVNDGHFHIAAPNIHNDDEYATSEGISGIIADGMISTNWISGELVKAFGQAYFTAGELQTKYIRPIYEDEKIETHILLKEITQSPSRMMEFEVWCQTTSGDMCTVGFARVPLA